jgi:long-chain acyl-CoA synthetase
LPGKPELGLPLSNGNGITECSPAISGMRCEAPRADHAWRSA